MDELTATERELARILREEGIHSEEDIAYYVGRLRTLIGLRQVGHLVGRKLKDSERQRAHVLLEAGESPAQGVIALTKR